MGTTHYFFSTTSANKLYETPLDDSFTEAILQAIMNNSSIPDALLASLLTGFTLNMDEYFTYGQEEYIYGLPKIRLGKCNLIVDWTWETNYTQSGFGNWVSAINKKFHKSLTTYPIAPLRINKVNVNSNKGSNWYKSTKALLDTIPLDVNELVASVNSNPDIANITYAWFQIMANVYDENVSINRYLVKFFEYLAANSRVSINAYKASRTFNSDALVNMIDIQEQGFDVQVTYSYITISEIEGVIGSVGFIQKKHYPKADSRFYMEICWGHLCWSERNSYFNGYMIIEEQITSTTFKRIKVHGLAILTDIDVDGVSKGNIITFSRKSKEQKEMNIPILPSILSTLNKKDEEQILYNGMSVKVNAAQHLVVPAPKVSGWDSFLKSVIQIIGIVLAPIPLGNSLSISQVIMNVIQEYVVKTVIDYAVQWLVESGIVPEQLAQIILAIAVTGIALEEAGIIGKGPKGLPWAEELLKISSTFKEKKMQELRDESDILQSDISAFQEEYTDKLESLGRKEAEYDSISHTLKNPLMLISDKFFNPSESPGDFYARTIHNGNPGVSSLDAIEYYATGGLKLPDANSTDNGFVV